MSNNEKRESLLSLRTPLENIREAVEALLPIGHNHDTADRISERAAKLIASVYKKNRIALIGKKPSGIMASAIYLATRMEEDVNISQFKVAEALGITVVTLRRGARQIKELLGLDIKKFRDRRYRYMCPFCEEAFTALDDRKVHIWRKKIKYASTLRVWMFNDDGVLVNEEILEKMRKHV